MSIKRIVMKNNNSRSLGILWYCLLALFLLLPAFKLAAQPRLTLAYKKAGLNSRQAAAHLLSRFTYGAKIGDVDQVLNMGLEKWFMQQLDGELNDEALNRLLNQFDAMKLNNTEVENVFPRNAQVLRFAIRDGYLNKDSVNQVDRKAYQATLTAYMNAKGYRPRQELYRQLINQKIVRAVYSNNQLRELMTDFWFNHFNVALSKNQCAAYIPAYERDVIRPNVFGKFEDLLIATAKSPAMLMYLDNFSSTGSNGQMDKPLATTQRKQGLNENYAREVMELHTMGVDGGYTQADVTQAARILTGWTIAPMSDEGYGAGMKKVLARIGDDNLKKRGFVRDGDFLFAMNRHDTGQKIVLGNQFPAGMGYQEGISLLKMLASQQATARFISKKIATRFVSDHPPQSLVDLMAKTFLDSHGEIKQVLISMVSAPEFWSADVLRAKTKSPFELTISAVRSLNATVKQPYQLYNWINKMGQPLYNYQAPTGFPDQGQYWINTGSLLSRMNFGLALAGKRIPGIIFDLQALNKGQESESANAALLTYSKLMMPERSLDVALERLKPMMMQPSLDSDIAVAAQQHALPVKENTMLGESPSPQKETKISMLAQVVGVIIGSPEFQRK